MQDNNKEILLVELLGARLLNPDGAGMVIERLSQASLVRLYRWFIDEHGGRDGALLLELAPILDTVIEMQSYLAPFPVPYEPEACAEGAEATEEPPGEIPGSEPLSSLELPPADAPPTESVPEQAPVGPQQEATPAASQYQHLYEPGSPQARCFAFFGSGLVLGIQYLELHVPEAGFPFPSSRSIEDFLSFISLDDYNPLPDPSMYTDGDNIVGPTCLTLRLVKLVPDLDLVLRAAYRLCLRIQAENCEAEDSDLHLRFIFFAGLVAAGLDLAGPARTGFQRYPFTT